jgi:hypothetical protein
MKKSYLPIFLLVLLLPFTLLFSGTTGKMAGVITDSETGEPLVGVNIVLEGTLFGAATDVDGYYVILQVPPGSYRVNASFIGYVDYTLTDVRVNIDLTTRLDFKLKPTVITGDAVTVVAQRPVVQPDVSASIADIQAEQIQALPVQSVEDVITLQAGVQGLNVRGGGSDQTAFVVDGFTLRDERDNTPFTGVALSAIADMQIQTGGFSAEYGNIRSGLINVVTREGDAQKYSGTITAQYSPAADKHFGPSFNDPNSYWLRPYLDPAVAWTGTDNGAWDENTQIQYPSFVGWNAISQQTLQDDDPSNDLTPEAAQRLFTWQHRRELDITKPDYNIDGGFGGPVPFISKPLGKLRFFISGRTVREKFIVPLARDQYEEDNFLLKLTSNVSPSMKLTLFGIYNNQKSVASGDVGLPGFFRSSNSIANALTDIGFIDSRIFYDGYFAPTQIERMNIGAEFSQSLSNTTFYNARLEHVRTKYNTFPKTWRNNDPIYEIVEGFFVDEAPVNTDSNLVFGIDGLLMGVRANARDFTKLRTTTFKFDITSQLDRINLVKAGLEFVHNNFQMEFGAINGALPSERPWTSWERNPIRFALYLQDKIEFQGLIANLGLRMDYVDPRGTWWDLDPFDQAFFSSDYDPDNPANDTLFVQTNVKKQTFLSPRLGVAHPITSVSKIYFNYGHFRQISITDRLFVVRRITLDAMRDFGDPDLPFQRTIAYELGYEHSLFQNYLLRLAGYYKDVSDQADQTLYQSANGKVRYDQSTSKSYEDIRGFEITLEKRAGKWLTGFINYTYQVNTFGNFGVGRIFENPAEQREYLRDNPPDQERPIARPYARANIIINTPSDFGFQVGNSHPLGMWNFSFLANWQSGRHFTWTNTIDVPGVTNNFQWSSFYNVDLRISRPFNIKNATLLLFADISNLFNFKLWQMGSTTSFSPTGFVGSQDPQDFNNYMRSLRLPRDKTEEFGYVPANGYGDDKPGDYRPDDVPYDPLEPNPNNDPAIEDRNNERIKNKSYIDNPNQTNLQFINPIDIFLGVKLSFNL